MTVTTGVTGITGITGIIGTTGFCVITSIHDTAEVHGSIGITELRLTLECSKRGFRTEAPFVCVK